MMMMMMMMMKIHCGLNFLRSSVFHTCTYIASWMHCMQAIQTVIRHRMVVTTSVTQM